MLDIADDWEELADGGKDDVPENWDQDEDETPDNWDDEEDNAEDPFGTVTVQRDTPKKPATAKKATPAAVVSSKKKKKFKPIKKKQLAKKLESNVKVDPLEEKMRQLKLQKDADLEHAEALFAGGANEAVVSSKGITEFTPKSEVEFLKFSSMLVDDISKYDKSEHYHTFILDLVRKLAGQMSSERVNEIISALNVVFKQKLADEKGKKKKTTKSKAFNDDFAADDFVDEDDYSYGFLS